MTGRIIGKRDYDLINPFTGKPYDALPGIPTSGSPILPYVTADRPPVSLGQQQTITTRAAGQRLPAIWAGTDCPVRTGGIIAYENIVGPYLIVLIAVCHGPIGSMSFTLDGAVPSGLGFTNGSIGPSGGYEVFLGTAGQAVSTIMSSVPGWTSSLPGIAYVALAYTTSGQSPNYTSFLAVVDQGLKVRDPRLGVDGNGIPNQPRVSSGNPFLAWADARTSRRYGAGDADASISWTDVTTGANDCDFNIGGGVKRFVMGWKVDNASRLNPESVTQDILKHCCGQEARYNGQWHAWVDKAQASSGLSLTETDHIVDASFREKGQSEVFNRVRVHFVNPTNSLFTDDSREDADPGVDSGVKEDTMLELTLGVPAGQAKRLATQNRKRSQKNREYFLTLGPMGTKITPGLRFSATSNQWGANVTKDLVATNSQCLGSTWQVRAEEYDAAVYPA